MTESIQIIELTDKGSEGYKEDQEENIDLINPQNSRSIEPKDVNK